jgi:dipeptidyl aminopeptidase/acylaminoacyl peptidase
MRTCRLVLLPWLGAIPALMAVAAPTPADELTRTVTLLAGVGRSFSPSFSPDGTQLAFVSDLGGVPQVFVMPTRGGWPKQITSGSDPVGEVRWSPAGDLLAYEVLPGGGLNAQLYLARPDGSQVWRVTDGGKENNRLGVWSKDGKLLTLGSNRRYNSTFDSYILDVATRKLRLVYSSDQGTGGLTSVSDDVKLAVRTASGNRGDSNLFLVDVTTGKRTLLTPHTQPAAFHGVIAPDGKSVYLSSNDGRDLSAFARIRIGKSGPGPIEVLAERADAELESFAVNNAGTAAALTWNVAGKSELSFVDLSTGASVAGPPLPAEITTAIAFSRDDRLLSLVALGPRAPMDVWVLDVTSKKLWQATQSPHPGITLQALVRPELVRFPAHDGLPLTAWLYRPQGSRKPSPYVISFHGGPESQERPAFRPDHQALLSQGIGVFAPNVRGSSGMGKKFVNLDNGVLRANAVADIKSCFDYLVTHGIADRGRVGIVGGSYGGYMVMAGMTEYPDMFAAGVNRFGIVNFATFFRNSEPWMSAISKVEYGDPETQKDLLEKLSPINKLHRLKGALMVQHGANDTNVPVIEAEQIVESQKKRGIPVEYILFPDEGHGWRKPANRIRSVVEMTRFFVQHLTADRRR